MMPLVSRCRPDPFPRRRQPPPSGPMLVLSGDAGVFLLLSFFLPVEYSGSCDYAMALLPPQHSALSNQPGPGARSANTAKLAAEVVYRSHCLSFPAAFSTTLPYVSPRFQGALGFHAISSRWHWPSHPSAFPTSCDIDQRLERYMFRWLPDKPDKCEKSLLSSLGVPSPQLHKQGTFIWTATGTFRELDSHAHDPRLGRHGK